MWWPMLSFQLRLATASCNHSQGLEAYNAFALMGNSLMDIHSSSIHQSRLYSSLYNLPPWANAWISLSVATPSGFSNNQPSWSQSAEFFVCTRVKTVVFASNWSRISTATSLTSDCKNICPNQPVKKFERNCLYRQSNQVGVTRQLLK